MIQRKKKKSIILASFFLLVTDTQHPEVTCPLDVQIFTDVGEATALYSWTVPRGRDNSGDPVTVQIQNTGVMSPHKFPYGTTIVKITAEDSSKLRSHCSFIVEVKGKQITEINK